MLSRILAKLREDNHRITKIRRVILELFSQENRPLSAVWLTSKLKEMFPSVNKTTIYRELNFLESKGFISRTLIGEKASHYELCDFNHKHHLICLDCKEIISIEQCPLPYHKAIELSTQNNFKIEYHSLEFFGHCKTCADKGH